jgi:serine protease Do
MDDKKIIKTIRQVMPAVVSIVVTKHLTDIEKEIPPEMLPFLPGGPNGEKKLNIPPELVDEKGMVQVGGGSGFIVAPEGLIVTNKHVIADPKAEYTVMTESGERFPAHILSRDPVNDVALIKIEATNLPVVRLGNSTGLELGQSVIAIGNALGLFKNTVSLGIISGLSRSITAQADPKSPPQEMRGLIQTDAAINPGNSGGPLVNIDGEAVAINSAIVYGAQNIGFAIPIHTAVRDVEDYRKYGHIKKALLGVRYIVIDERLKSKMNLPVDYGAIIMQETVHDHGVVPGSPADKAGLKERDIILECNSSKVDKDHPIQDFLNEMNVGDEIEMLVLRGKKQFKTTVVLAERK